MLYYLSIGGEVSLIGGYPFDEPNRAKVDQALIYHMITDGDFYQKHYTEIAKEDFETKMGRLSNEQ